jgi:hypothetical protein
MIGVWKVFVDWVEGRFKMYFNELSIALHPYMGLTQQKRQGVG